MKQEMISYVSTIKDEILSISKYMYANPEKSYEEFKCCDLLSKILLNHGFNVINNYCDTPTAFYGEFGHGHPKICFICHLDASEKDGHSSGHNVTTAISVGAALALSKILNKIDGTVIVLGCPGEYLGGSKLALSKEGAFKDIDATMLIQPYIETMESGTSKAKLPVKIAFDKKCFPPEVLNLNSSLDACLYVFNGFSLLEKSFPKEVALEDLEVKGGDLHSEVKLLLAADKSDTMEMIRKKMKELVTTTSNIFDIPCTFSIYQHPSAELKSNQTLSRIFSHNLKEAGIIDIKEPTQSCLGCSLGCISKDIPCIHPYISIIEDQKITFPSPEFALATQSYYAEKRLLQGVEALAKTAFDLMENQELLLEVRKDQ
ncbi:MAG TPA: M20 family peptidase [Clostridiaceae bacterium]